MAKDDCCKEVDRVLSGDRVLDPDGRMHDDPPMRALGFRLSGLVAALSVAAFSWGCHGSGAQGECDARPDSGRDDAGMDASPPEDGVAPMPDCAAEETTGEPEISLFPPFPRPGLPLELTVTSQVGHTNVELLVCGPGDPPQPTGPEVHAGSPNRWIWQGGPLAEGTYQAQFLADPADTLYRTLEFSVLEDPTDADGDGHANEAAGGDDCDDADPAVHPGAAELCGDGVDADCDGADLPCVLCEPPAGSILAHGEFEEGMSGQAPTGWAVRNPSAPSSCPGTADSHVYLSSAPTGCAGNALSIDAGGTWDCYAVQTVSGYSTIEAGRTYRVSAAVRSQGNAVNPAAWFVLGVQWVDAGDAFFGDEKNPATTSAAENDFDWNLLTFDLVAPTGATRILVWLTAHYPGRVDYDNVSVVLVE